jgi:hypothetical protein
MDRRYYCLSSKVDFDNAQPTRISYVAGEPAGGQWTFDSTTGITKFNANNGGYFRVRIGAMNIGDIINVSMEVYNISGVKAKSGVDFATVNYGGGGAGSTGFIQSQKIGEWEILKGAFIVSADNPYTTLTLGIYGAEVGNFYVRNVSIEVLTVKEGEKSSRKATIKNTTGTFASHPSFKNDDCTITTTDANTLKIQFKTFAGLNAALRPQVFVGQEFSGSSNLYTFRASNGFNNSDYATMDVRFYDQTATVIPLTSIADGTAFGVLMVI